MLEITNPAGQALQLPLGEKLTMELVSTILTTDDVLQGSYSYPFRFPMNEHNTRWLGGGTTAEPLSQREYPVKLSVDGIPMERGIMRFRISGKYADAYLKIDLGEVARGLKEMRLRNLMNERYPLGSTLLDVWNTLNNVSFAQPGSTPVVFPPFRNLLMIEPEFAGGEGYVKPYTFNRFVPWPGTLFVPGVIGHLVNPERDAHKHLLVPMVPLVYIIRKLATKLGFTAMGEWLADKEVQKMVLFNTQAIPAVPVETYNTPTAALPGGTLYVQLARHLPDISVGDFLKSLRSWMGVGLFFKSSTRTLRLKSYRTIKNETAYQDFTEGFVPDTDQYEWPDKTGFTLQNYLEDGDELLKESPYYATFNQVADGSQAVSLTVGTCLMYRGANIDSWPTLNQGWTIPEVRQPGNIADDFYTESKNYSPYQNGENADAGPTPKNKFGLRLLLYHGMQPDATGDLLYPLASSLSYNYAYETVGGLSLLPGEPDDVFAQHQRYYYEMLAGSQHIQVELVARLSQLEGFAPEQVVGLRLRNGVFSKWLPERLTYELPAREGRVRVRFQGVQLIPTTIKSTIPDGALYGAVWVKFVTENTSTEENFNFRVETGDVVVYFYEKGNQTGPVDVPSMLINYRQTTIESDENSQVTLQETADLTDTANGLSFTLRSATLLREEEGYIDPQNPQLEAFRLRKLITYSLLPGTGYRVIQ